MDVIDTDDGDAKGPGEGLSRTHPHEEGTDQTRLIADGDGIEFLEELIPGHAEVCGHLIKGQGRLEPPGAFESFNLLGKQGSPESWRRPSEAARGGGRGIARRGIARRWFWYRYREPRARRRFWPRPDGGASHPP